MKPFFSARRPRWCSQASVLHNMTMKTPNRALAGDGYRLHYRGDNDERAEDRQDN
jgi:hypothetical protein